MGSKCGLGNSQSATRGIYKEASMMSETWELPVLLIVGGLRKLLALCGLYSSSLHNHGLNFTTPALGGHGAELSAI